MRIIKRYKDIEILTHAEILPIDYLTHLEEYFKQLREALGDGEPLDKFSLDKHGFIVILEKGDNVRNLSTVGLHPENNGLINNNVEFIDQIDLETISIYRIGVLYTNEYMMLFFSEVWAECRS